MLYCIKASAEMKSRCCINISQFYEVYQIVDKSVVFKLARFIGCAKGNIYYSQILKHASHNQVNIVLAMCLIYNAKLSIRLVSCRTRSIVIYDPTHKLHGILIGKEFFMVHVSFAMVNDES
jgi:hypothetical protein